MSPLASTFAADSPEWRHRTRPGSLRQVLAQRWARWAHPVRTLRQWRAQRAIGQAPIR